MPYSTMKPGSIPSHTQGRQEGGGGGQLGHFAWAPKNLYNYSDRTVKYSIKAVTTYILPWAPQALLAALTIPIMKYSN